MWQWGPDMATIVIARLSRPCIGMLALCGYLHIIATLHSTICVILLLCLTFATTHPTPLPFSPTPLYTQPNINEFQEKIINNWR